MPGKILGIDISEQNISATQVISGLKGYQLESCFSTPIEDNNLEKALEDLSKHFDLKNDKCLVTISPSFVSFRNINTPFKDTKKIRKTLPFEIENHVPFAVDGMIIDYNHTDDDDRTAILTAAANKEFVADFLEKLNTVGIDSDIIDIRPVPAVIWIMDQETSPDSGLYLDLEPEHQCIVLFKNKKIVLIRDLAISFAEKDDVTEQEDSDQFLSESIDNLLESICHETSRTVHSFKSQENNNFTIEKIFYGGSLSGYNNIATALSDSFKTNAERVNISGDKRLRMDPGLSRIYEPSLMDNALAVSMRESKKNIGFNLRRDQFAVKKRIFRPGKDLKTLFILLSIVFVFLIINMGMDYFFLSKKHAIVEEHFNKEFDKKFSEHKGTKDLNYRLLILQQKLDESNKSGLQGSGGINPNQKKVLDILKEISLLIDETYTLDVKSMVIETNTVRINGNTDSFDAVDKIANKLKSSELFRDVENIKPRSTKDGITFDLTLERAQ